MFGDSNLQKNSPKILEHKLNQYFPELLKFESIEETEKSAVYQKIKADVERILNAVVQENFAPKSEPSAVADGLRKISEANRVNDTIQVKAPATAGGSDTVRALAWNI